MKRNDTAATVRLDRWLWAARFYKTRSLAAAAVRGGRVQINGSRTKPSRAVRVGDRLGINRDAWRKEVVVTALVEQRGSATLAATLYEETAQSIERRKLEAEARRGQRAAAPRGRPDKRARRQLRNLARGDD